MCACCQKPFCGGYYLVNTQITSNMFYCEQCHRQYCDKGQQFPPNSFVKVQFSSDNSPSDKLLILELLRRNS